MIRSLFRRKSKEKNPMGNDFNLVQDKSAQTPTQPNGASNPLVKSTSLPPIHVPRISPTAPTVDPATPAAFSTMPAGVDPTQVAPMQVGSTPVVDPALQQDPSAPPQIATPPQPRVRPRTAHGGPALIRMDNITKAYETPNGPFLALKEIDLRIGKGEFVAVVGKSGSGKSTLINMITGIDRPTEGEIYIAETPIHNLGEGPMAEWRGRNVGVIFQFFQLLPMLTCVENVMLPMDFCKMYKPSERRKRAIHLLDMVEMADQADKLPSEVSGGQQQRVAIARALSNDPPVIVADEPTGNLDSKTADAVFQMFERLINEGKTILMVTHDDELAQRVTRRITIADGVIVGEEQLR